MTTGEIRAASTLDVFSRRWQDACRFVIMFYCNLPEKRRRGEPMKMTLLRHEIMEDFDTFENGKRVMDRSLGREELDHWIKNENYLSTTKFQYVDRWIRKIYLECKYDHIFDTVIEYKQEFNMAALTGLYSRHAKYPYEQNSMWHDSLAGHLFLSDILKAPEASKAAAYSRYSMLSDYRQIALYFDRFHEGSISVTAAYLDAPLSDLRKEPDMRQWPISFGYVTIEGDDEFLPCSHGVLHMFRDAFPGHHPSGTSVSQFTLYPGDDKLHTTWFPQVGSQNLTGFHHLETPALNLEQSDGFAGALGNLKFHKQEDGTSKIKEYIKNLKNRYLIW
ncbi:MAG: hypothetical protein E2598_06115 [Sphingobium sp.]|nr:hypothetical protein [Sphingobium sp.]